MKKQPWGTLKLLPWALELEGLDPVSKLVLIGLANHANHKDEAWPARRTLSRYAGISTRSVSNHLRKLEKLGLIEVVERFNGGRQTSNLCRLTPEGPGEKADDLPDEGEVKAVEADNTPALVSPAADNSPLEAGNTPPLKPEVQGVLEAQASSHEELSLTMQCKKPPCSPPRGTAGEEDCSGTSHEPKPSPANLGRTEFEHWWRGVWRRDGKSAAAKAYARARREYSAEFLLDQRDRHRRYYEHEGTETRYRLHPSTWLNGQRWEDEQVALWEEKQKAPDYDDLSDVFPPASDEEVERIVRESEMYS